MKKNIITRIGAGLIAVIAGTTIYQANTMKQEPLVESPRGVEVKYTSMLGEEQCFSGLREASAEDIVNFHCRLIVKGTVQTVQKISLLNGMDSREYSLVTIHVEKVYKGEEKRSEITILMPCEMDAKEEGEHTSFVSQIRIGMTGIFLPVSYDGSYYKEDCDGSRIYLKDLAEYGLMDGKRFVFLQSDDGMLYEKQVYKELGAEASLEEVEDYISNQLSRKES